jgi:hypothetical protein
MTRHRPPKTADEDRTYEVGYRKPPKEHTFKKGDRANPAGRPRKHESNGQIVQELLSKTLNVQVDGKTVAITARAALFRAQLARAVKGDRYAAEFLFRHLDDAAQTLDMTSLEAADRAIISSFFMRETGSDPDDAASPSSQREGRDDQADRT